MIEVDATDTCRANIMLLRKDEWTERVEGEGNIRQGSTDTLFLDGWSSEHDI